MLQVLALQLTLLLTASAQEPVDLDVIHRIKTEAFQNPKVMDTMFQLTDVHGPRLTGSPQFKAAGDWAVKQLTEYGLQNVKLEKWGPFGRGWNYTHYSGHMLEPVYQPLIGYPLAWTPGTEGVYAAEATVAVIRREEDMAQFKGKLAGKIVLRDAPRNLTRTGHAAWQLDRLTFAPRTAAPTGLAASSGGGGSYIVVTALNHGTGEESLPCAEAGASSSGGGTAMSFWAANVGTETAGSILSPSNANMLAGIKPTVGRVSRHGVIPITADQDTPGPMARTVEDAALLTDVLLGRASIQQALLFARRSIRCQMTISCRSEEPVLRLRERAARAEREGHALPPQQVGRRACRSDP